MPKVRLYVSKQKWVEIEVPEDKADGYKQVNRDLWHQYDINDKEIVMSIYQKNAEPDEEWMENMIADASFNPFELFLDKESELEKQQLLSILKDAVSTLKPEQQEIIRMYFEEGKTYEAIGDVLGKSKPAIKQNLDTILKKLKTFF